MKQELKMIKLQLILAKAAIHKEDYRLLAYKEFGWSQMQTEQAMNEYCVTLQHSVKQLENTFEIS